MRYSIKVMMSLCVISLLIAGGSHAFGQDWSKEQKEVLELEKQYWNLYKAGNISDLMKLFHKDYRWWPNWSSYPIGKGQMEYESQNRQIPNCNLNPIAIKIFNGFAIIYARYSILQGGISTIDAVPLMYANEGRVGHVCIKQAGTWQLIGGYSGGSKADHTWSTSIPVERLSKEQKEVLKMEEKYWDLLKAGNLSDLMILHHEDYLGWPHWQYEPIGKMQYVSDVIKQRFTSYDLKTTEINIFGGLAVIYANYSNVGADGNKNEGRVGHVFMKHGGKWQIIGMYSGGSKADGQ